MADRIDQLKKLLSDDPDSPFLIFALAKESEKVELTDQALSFYEKLTSQHPEYTGTYYHYAHLLMELGRHEEGFAMYDIGIRVCRSVGDQHALSELLNARTNWELEL